MAYEDFKNLPRRTASDKILAKNLKYDGYQIRLVSMVFKFRTKKTSVLRTYKNSKNSKNQF